MLTTAAPALLPVYATFPLRAASGHGSWLVDEDGHEWLDAYGGHAVATCGHSHPDVVAAIGEQAARLLFYSTAVPHAGREQLAAAIVARSPAPLAKVFFCNSGAEANENLLGLARRRTGALRGPCGGPAGLVQSKEQWRDGVEDLGGGGCTAA